MLRYVIRRLLTAIPTLFLIVTISFFLMRVAPGGPFNQERGLNPTVKANLERVYHLDEPLWKQYLYYLNDLLHGDFGPSYNLPDFTVADLFRVGLPVSMQLGASALILALLVGGVLGIVAALNQNRAGDYAVIAIATVGSTVPTFVIAPLYQLVFALTLVWVPVAGWGGGAHRQQDRPGRHAGAAADRHRRAADARLDDRGAALPSHPHGARARPVAASRSSSSMRCAARCCRSSPMPARPRRRCSPARSSSRRSSPFPASAATSSMRRSTATTRWSWARSS